MGAPAGMPPIPTLSPPTAPPRSPAPYGGGPASPLGTVLSRGGSDGGPLRPPAPPHLAAVWEVPHPSPALPHPVPQCRPAAGAAAVRISALSPGALQQSEALTAPYHGAHLLAAARPHHAAPRGGEGAPAGLAVHGSRHHACRGRLAADASPLLPLRQVQPGSVAGFHPALGSTATEPILTRSTLQQSAAAMDLWFSDETSRWRRLLQASPLAASCTALVVRASHVHALHPGHSRPPGWNAMQPSSCAVWRSDTASPATLRSCLNDAVDMRRFPFVAYCHVRNVAIDKLMFGVVADWGVRGRGVQWQRGNG